MMRLKRWLFRKLVREAMASLPDHFVQRLDNLDVLVEMEPAPEDLARGLVEQPDELLGLYVGTPLPERSDNYNFALPDRIILYQSNIEALCRSHREVREQIALTLRHEIAHHFGIDDKSLEQWGVE